MKIVVAAVVSLLLLAGCTPPGPEVRPDRVDDDQVRIERQLERQAYRAAAQGWEELAERNPEQAPLFRVRAAEAWLLEGDADRAEALLEPVDPARLDPLGRHRLDLARAELAMQRGDLAMAGWLLSHAAENLPERLRDRHQELEQRLEALESQPVRAALAAMEEAMAEGDFEPELALALLIEHPLSALEEVLYDFGDRIDLLPWLDLAISAREYLLDDTALSSALQAWQRRYPTIGYDAEEALLWIAAWRQSRPRPAVIAVALPGPGAALYRPGQALRDGLLAGWLEIMPQHRPELRFLNVGDDPGDILATWFDAREQGAEFLIGPLERAQVNELLSLPDAGFLPTLLLNLPDDLEMLREGNGVSSLALPPEEEAELAAVRALVDGHRRALVLAQRTSWGDRVAQAFVDTFMLGGGEILERRSYDPGNTDHSSLLTDALRIDESERRAEQLARLLGQAIESAPQRRTDVDLIFLAARAEDGRQIRPQLRFFDAGDVPLMATSHIVSGSPRPERDRDLDGVVVPIAPWFLEFTPAGQTRLQAERQHQLLTNAALSRLYALGRDAMGLVPWLDLMEQDPHLYLPGMTGRLSKSDGAVLSRDLPFILIDNGRARSH